MVEAEVWRPCPCFACSTSLKLKCLEIGRPCIQLDDFLDAKPDCANYGKMPPFQQRGVACGLCRVFEVVEEEGN